MCACECMCVCVCIGQRSTSDAISSGTEPLFLR